MGFGRHDGDLKCSLNINFQDDLQLHVKNGQVQGDPALGVVGVVLQREWSVRKHRVRGDSVLLVSHRQRVGVDVVDLRVVLRPLLSSEKGEWVTETIGFPLTRNTLWLFGNLGGHGTLIDTCPLTLPVTQKYVP